MAENNIKKQLNFFDMLREITEHKSCLDFDDPEIIKAYDIYMINRYLSMLEMFVPFVQDLNRSGVSKRVHYLFFKSLIPKGRYRFNYIKKSKDPDRMKKVKCVAKYFEVGYREAQMYIDQLPPEKVKEIIKMYSYGKNGKQILSD